MIAETEKMKMGLSIDEKKEKEKGTDVKSNINSINQILNILKNSGAICDYKIWHSDEDSIYHIEIIYYRLKSLKRGNRNGEENI